MLPTKLNRPFWRVWKPRVLSEMKTRMAPNVLERREGPIKSWARRHSCHSSQEPGCILPVSRGEAEGKCKGLICFMEEIKD